MKQKTLKRLFSRRLLLAGMGIVWAVMTIACSSEMNFNPAGPSFPLPTSSTPGLFVESGRDLEISGTLRTEGGTCIEATVLYDGVELKGARTLCRKASGCTRVQLTALAKSSTGLHTISFQVLRQTSRVVSYWADGTVRVSRDGIFLGGATLPLGPNLTKLKAGESVSFDISFQN